MTPHKAANRTTIGPREYLEPGTQGDNMDVPVQAEQAGRRADDSDWMDHAVRVGLVSYGIVHLIIAWLALRLAFGDGGGSASSQGALQQVAKTGVGQVSLYVAGLGFVALVVWQALEAIWGHRDEDGGKRVLKRLTSAAKVVLYVSLAVSAARTAAGSSSSSGGTDGMTAKVMELPGGPVLVGAVGVGVLVVAGFLAFRGLSEGFRSKLDSGGQTGKDGRAYVLFGKIGYVAKAVALAIVGVLFLYAAVTHDPDKSAGLDQALHKLIQQPFGSPLLVLVALGFACYGLFAFAWARHLDR
jgi:type IV secretory pathway VirB2 component (pilin)